MKIGKGILAHMAAVLFSTLPVLADPPLPGSGGGNDGSLASWQFSGSDTNLATSAGQVAISQTNVSTVFDLDGDQWALQVDSTNGAWAAWNTVESDGTTNLALGCLGSGAGSVLMWVKPAWTSTNLGGAGPGVFGRLIEVGTLTTNAAYGYFGLYVDPSGCWLSLLTQTNSGGEQLCFSAPISWETDVWHFVALTYGSGTACYVDGVLLTNAPAITVWPPLSVATNGFSIGSSRGDPSAQFHGLIDDVITFSVQLDDFEVEAYWDFFPAFFERFELRNPPPSPGTNYSGNTFSAFTGPGYLTPITTNAGCVVSSKVWFTNLTALNTSTNVIVTFAIAGGSNGVSALTGAPRDVYDVFGTDFLQAKSITNIQWTLIGRASRCVTYQFCVTNAPMAVMVMSSVEDSDLDGLTDAFELLVSKSRWNVPDSSGDGMPDGWKVFWGLDPSANNIAQPGLRANYSYDAAGRLVEVSGLHLEAVQSDKQGSILSDH